MTGFPKPEPRQRTKARAKRVEDRIAKIVRAEVDARDGYCLIRNQTSDCAGPSEWAHAHEKRRSKTRGLPPTERHTTAGSFKACKKHHDQYDGRRRPRLYFETDVRGFNGKVVAYEMEDGHALPKIMCRIR